MRFRLISDIHLEIGSILIPDCGNDKDTILLLAGDICTINKSKTLELFFHRYTNMFGHIAYVCGNHEFYRGYLNDSVDDLKNIASKFPNVSILDDETITLSGVSIIGSTLWTNFDNGSKQAMDDAERGLNDYRQIALDKKSKQRIYSSHILDKHERSIKFICSSVEKEKNKGNKTVVLTHHSPSYISVHTKYLNSFINPAFSSDLNDLILSYAPDVWCHGHTHESFTYRIGKTMIYCNPRGYEGYEYNGIFNPSFNFRVE